MSNSNVFEVRLKSNGRLFSRHYTANSAEQAAGRARGKGIIQSVRKVHSADIIGTIDSMKLDDIIGVKIERRQPNVMLNGTTLDSIVFPKIGQSQKKTHRKERFLRKQKNQQEV